MHDREHKHHHCNAAVPMYSQGKAVLNRPYAAYIPHGHAHEDHGPASPSALMAAALAGGGPLLAAVFGDMSLGSTPLHSARGGSMPGHPDMGTRMSGPGMAPAFTQGQAPFVSMYPMASPPDTSRSQQGVSMMRHKPPRELSPIKQRAMAFRTNISKSTRGWLMIDKGQMKGAAFGALQLSHVYQQPALAMVPDQC